MDRFKEWLLEGGSFILFVGVVLSIAWAVLKVLRII